MFLTVGISNAIVDVFILNLLLYIEPTLNTVKLTIYNSIAVCASILNSYVWNSLWTFKDVSTRSSKEKVLFLLQACINIFINDAILVMLTILLKPVTSLSPFVQNNLSKAVAMFVSSMISYSMMHFFIFRRRDTER